MKRKFFSTLLMGAFFIASMSMFTSCKDYDDDINSNKDAITALQKQLTTLQAALDQAKADATTAHATFLTKTDAANTYLTKTDAASTYASKAATEDALKALQTEMAKMATADQLQTAITDLKALIDGKASKQDLQDLSTKVDGINTSLNTLTSDVAGLKSAQDDLTEAIKAANDNIKAQQDALGAFEDAVKTTYATNEALKNYVTTSDYTAKINDLQDQISTLKASAGDAKSIEELKGDMQKLSDKVDKLSANINVLTFLVNSKLTSLVLKPEYYYEGIEAVEYPIIAGESKLVKDAKNEVWSASTNPDDDIYIANYGIAAYHVNPTSAQLKGYNVDFYGNYAKTRSGADIVAPLQKTIDDKFLAENYSDGILSVPFQVSGFENLNKNTIAKAYNDFYGKEHSSLNEWSMPMIALQLSKSNKDTQNADSVITSDYALVNVTRYTNLTIADNIWKGTDDCTDGYLYTSSDNSLSEDLAVSGHLHKIFKDLTPDQIPATHEVLFSGSIDLKQYMNVHYAYGYDNDRRISHKIMSDEVFKALGLKYKFTPIDYTLGTNKTSESQHIKIDANTGIATPVQVDNNGKRTDVQANQASVGRLPIIRVELEDAKDNTLAVGYIKLKIVEKESIQTVIDQTLDGTAYVDCNGGGAATMTWAAFENNVYGKLGLSRENFEKAYKLDVNGSWTWNPSSSTWVAVANQYFEANEASKSGNDEDHPIIGKVKYVEDWGDAHTAVLQWSFDENDYKTLSDLKLIKDGKTTADLTTYVRFTGASNVYIKLTIPAGSVRFVSGTISNKNLSYWYKLNSNTGASTNAEAIDVRINVPTPKTETDPAPTSDKFTKDLTDFFTNKTVQVEGVDSKNFKNFIANAQTDFTFTTPSKANGNAEFDADEDGQWTVYGDSWYNDNGTWKHNEYTLKVNNNEDEIIAVEKNGASIRSTIIATLSGINNRVITYMHNDVADDVLNYASHISLKSKETFSAYIKVTYNSCYDADLQNSNYFNARFLRPVNLNPTKDQKIVDAPNGGADVDVAKLYGLTDWRDYVLVDKYDKTDTPFTGKFVVKSYYGISVDPSGTCYTDIALGAGKRTILGYNNIDGIRNLAKTTDISKLEFTLVPATATKGAYFHYDNNEANVEEFHIYVPLTVTYTWGTKVQAGYAVVTVQKTIAQSKKN